MRLPIRRDDPAIISEEDGHISPYVEENLATPGKGIENAHRRVENGVAWLSWGGIRSVGSRPKPSRDGAVHRDGATLRQTGSPVGSEG